MLRQRLDKQLALLHSVHHERESSFTCSMCIWLDLNFNHVITNAAAYNHVILYCFLPEGKGEPCCHAGVIQLALSLTHDNG